MTTTARPRTPSSVPRSSHRRRRRAPVVAVLVILIVTGAGGWIWWHGSIGPLSLRPHCTATALGNSSELDPEQAGNAAIIAAVAVKRGLPGRAATIGIATALQESKLVNLPGGDRDSIGLFQQRPSQGWGTPAQIRDPVYATNAFYDVLVKIEGYQSLPITAAAQKVQRSAFPSAYAEHEPEARILASALTGYSPAGLACVLGSIEGGSGPPAAVVSAASREIGASGTVEGSAVRFTFGSTPTSTSAWAVAQWAVARADGLKITSVETAGERWDRGRTDRGWTRVSGAAPAGTVVVHLD